MEISPRYCRLAAFGLDGPLNRRREAHDLMDIAILLHDRLCGPTRHRSAMSILHDTTGLLGLAALLKVVSELGQFSVSSPFSPQPPVTLTVGRSECTMNWLC